MLHILKNTNAYNLMSRYSINDKSKIKNHNESLT